MHVEPQVAMSVLYRLQRDSLNVTDRSKLELDYEIKACIKVVLVVFKYSQYAIIR